MVSLSSDLTKYSLNTSDDVLSLRGWLPVDAVVVDGRPGLRWMDLADVQFSEPFFSQTIKRAITAKPDRGQRFTEFDALLQVEKVVESVAPTGFIFHSSRCGSTLVANTCKALSGSIVISEATAIDKLIARFITDTSVGDLREKLYSVFLRSLVRVLGQQRAGDEQHLFVKFSCCSVVQLERIRRIWPEVPWLFMYRDPVETIVSNLTTVPEWLADEDNRVLGALAGTTSVEVSKMSREELCARTLGNFYSTVESLASDNCMLLNYNQLSLAVILQIIRFFRVELEANEVATITATSKLYSKDVSSGQNFIPDSISKRTQASNLVRQMAAEWCAGPYNALEAKRALVNRES